MVGNRVLISYQNAKVIIYSLIWNDRCMQWWCKGMVETSYNLWTEMDGTASIRLQSLRKVFHVQQSYRLKLWCHRSKWVKQNITYYIVAIEHQGQHVKTQLSLQHKQINIESPNCWMQKIRHKNKSTWTRLPCAYLSWLVWCWTSHYFGLCQSQWHLQY